MKSDGFWDWYQTKDTLPVMDVAVYDMGDKLIEQKFIFQLGPVCFVY